METLGIPVFQDRISPRLDYAENFILLEIKNKTILKKESIKIITRNRLERINRIVLLNPDLVICNGLTERCYVELTKSDIKVIPWIKGDVDEVLNKYLNGFIRELGKHKFGNKLKIERN